MTTIAYDGRTLAADRRVSTSNGTRYAPVTKLRRLPDGRLVGCGGSLNDGIQFVDWLLDSARKETRPRLDESFRALVIDADGRLLDYEQSLIPTEEGVPFAIGSGSAYARAAMACGKTAAEAVGVAERFDLFTGDGVDTLP